MGYDVVQIVRKDNLTELCTKVKQLHANEFKTLMQRVQNVIKTV